MLKHRSQYYQYEWHLDIYVCNLAEITNEDIYLSLLKTDKLNIFCKTK